jgi:hypothetical protein
VFGGSPEDVSVGAQEGQEGTIACGQPFGLFGLTDVERQAPFRSKVDRFEPENRVVNLRIARPNEDFISKNL